MMNVNDYRSKASECKRLAALSKDDLIRADYLMLASQWEFLQSSLSICKPESFQGYIQTRPLTGNAR